jgi:competence protein ComEC
MPQSSPDFRPAFSRHPFFYVFSYFSIGILCSANNSVPPDMALFVNCLILVIGFLFLTSSPFQTLAKHFILCAILSFLGSVATREQQVLNAWDDWTFHDGKTQFNLKVTEIQSGSPWKKGIGEIHWKKNNQTRTTSVRFYFKGDYPLRLDEWIHVSTKVLPIENKGNPGEFDLKQYLKTKGIEGQFFLSDQDFKHLRYEQSGYLNSLIRAGQNKCLAILSAHLSGQELGITQALILGDKSMLDNEIRSAFTATGAMHILAVSGLHIGLILQLLLYVIKFGARWIHRSKAIWMVIGLLWFYALLTGFSPSVIRAVFMFSVLTWAQHKGWQSSSINTLFFTAFVIVLWRPMYFFDIGFQLSYLAMIGIFLFYPTIARTWKPKNKISAYLWEGTAIGFAAQIATTPLTLFYFHQFPNYFALANLGLMGLSTLVLGAGIFILALHFVPIMGKLNGLFLFYAVFVMFQFIQWIESWPGALVYGFELPLLFIPILFFLACILVLGDHTTHYWKISSLHLIFILLCISVTRYQNTVETHVCILNDNKLTVLLKTPNKTYCFFDAPNRGKIQFNVQNYLKIHPSQIQYVPIHERDAEIKLNQHHFFIKQESFGRKISWNKNTWRICYQVNPMEKADEKTVFMPWIKHVHSLHHGSKIIPIAMN